MYYSDIYVVINKCTCSRVERWLKWHIYLSFDVINLNKLFYNLFYAIAPIRHIKRAMAQ